MEWLVSPARGRDHEEEEGEEGARAAAATWRRASGARQGRVSVARYSWLVRASASWLVGTDGGIKSFAPRGRVATTCFASRRHAFNLRAVAAARLHRSAWFSFRLTMRRWLDAIGSSIFNSGCPGKNQASGIETDGREFGFFFSFLFFFRLYGTVRLSLSPSFTWLI